MITVRRLESDIVDICNFSCKNCGHLSPYYGKNLYSFEEFRADITMLSRIFRCNVFRILGGEPMILGEKLRDYVEVLRERQISTLISITTNGSFLAKSVGVLDLFDIVEVNVYPGNPKEKEIEAWVDSHKSAYPNLVKHKPKEFETNFVSEKLTEDQAQHSWDVCKAKHECHQLYRGHYYRCGPCAKFHTVLDAMNVSNDHHKGCAIHEPDLERRLQEYIDDDAKLTSCSFCLGHWDYYP